MSERAKKLEQVRALLEHALATPFEEEADAFRRKADDFMLAYAISTHEVEMSKPKDKRTKPEVREFLVTANEAVTKSHVIDLFTILTQHARTRTVFYNLRSKYGPVRAKVVGFAEDLDYLDLLFTTLLMQVARTLDPKYDPLISLEENLYKMKRVGMKWEDIFKVCGIPYVQPDRSRTFGKYKRYCQRTGQDMVYVQPRTYVHNFFNGFNAKIMSRLREIRLAQAEERTVAPSGSKMELVLADRSAVVDQTYKEMFPNLTSAPSRRTNGKFDPQSYAAGSAAGARADLGQTRVGGSRKEIDS